MNTSKLPKHFWNTFKLCADLVNYIPNRQDSSLAKAIKIGSVIGIVRTHLHGEEGAITEFVKKHSLEKSDNTEFGNMFFSTPIKELFEITQIKLDQYHEIIKAENEQIGTLCFIKYVWNGGSRIEERFYHTAGFRFEVVLDYMWKAFNGRINTEIASGAFGSQSIKYTKLPFTDDPIFGSSIKKLKSILKKHHRYMNDDQPRTYLMRGEPGTGKSTMALRLAEKIGGKALRLDSKSLNKIGPDEVTFLLSNLKPNCLVLDDVDKAIMKEGLTTVLAILEWVKQDHPEIVIFMTVNNPKLLDKAMVRPGRVDEIITFKLPNIKNRTALLDGYINYFNSKMPKEKFKQKILEESEGLGAPWIKEIAIQLRYENPKFVLKVISDMKMLLNDMDGDKKEDDVVENDSSPEA